MAKTFKWAIIGTGRIANEMAHDLQLLKNVEITAVLSRTQENAEKFAKKYSIPNIFFNRDEFAAFTDVDVVYVASPHNAHYVDTMLCLESGKNVLCEKAMAVNAREAAAMINKAGEKQLFLMEAMWMAFFPAIQKAQTLIQKGKIGEVRQIDANFFFYKTDDPKHRLLNPDLAGGAMLDIGIYVLYFAILMMNELPVSSSSVAYLGKTGVDESSSYLLRFKKGTVATLASSVMVEAERNAAVYGTAGKIQVPLFWNPDKFYCIKNGKKKTYKYKRQGNGFTFEAEHVMDCIKKGKIESNVITHEHSLKLAELMDSFRREWGLKYPFEA
ncbi:Gfo/Idh/MocA family protein [Saccharicrinis sp. FJH62]|uniref:Gfo/Idh/MocA family protein n=1 Tax=Saccharicrinis sp. FJH62 TaxID=3344657 RepID=UPI0035D41706